MSPRRGPWQVLRAPALLALAAALGLTAGLVGDGMWDVAATLGLLMPVPFLGALVAPRIRRAKPLPARNGPAKSAPHPRSPAPSNAERA